MAFLWEKWLFVIKLCQCDSFVFEVTKHILNIVANNIGRKNIRINNILK